MMGRIVVGVDGSDCSVAALRWAIGQARLTDAQVDVVGAWNLAATHGYVPVDWDFEQETARMLDETVARAVEAGDRNRVRTRVWEGAPAATLLDAAAGADLLVVGSRGRRGFAGLLLGSVSQQVVAHSPCPAVVVHEPAG